MVSSRDSSNCVTRCFKGRLIDLFNVFNVLIYLLSSSLLDYYDFKAN